MMILTDKITGQRWEIFVSDGQIGYRQAPDTHDVDYNPVVLDSELGHLPYTPTQIFKFFTEFIPQRRPTTDVYWTLEIEDSQMGLAAGGLYPMHPWVRDEVNPSVIWEFRAEGGEVYIAQLSTTGLGRIVFLLSGRTYQVYNLSGQIYNDIDLTSSLTSQSTLSCLIPQEEFI